MKQKSFTLIEILVVIVVIGILSAFILVGMGSISESANIAKSKTFSDSIRNSLLTNLVSEWKLDETSGTTTYDSWGTNNGTLVGSSHLPVWTTESNCISKNCLEFDGAEDRVSMGNQSSLNINGEVTLSGWVNFYRVGQEEGLFGRGNHTGAVIDRGPYFLGIYNNQIWWVLGDGTTSSVLSPSFTPKINKWYYIVATWNGTTSSSGQKLYIDGLLYSYMNSLVSSLQDRFDFLIGCKGSFSRFFNGKIDEIMVYNKNLLINKIQQNYFLGLNNLYKNKGMTKNEYIERIAELKINLTQE